MENITNEKILNKIDKKYKLTEKEIQVFMNDNFQVDEIEGVEHRWYREITTIIERNNRYFAIEWNRGLTECQEHEFPNQPYEVEPKDKVIVINEWVKKESEEN